VAKIPASRIIVGGSNGAHSDGGACLHGAISPINGVAAHIGAEKMFNLSDIVDRQ